MIQSQVHFHQSTAFRSMFISLIGALSIMFSAKASIPLHPVPMTLQPTILCLMGLVMLPQTAVMSVFYYLCMGFMGLPVFASGKIGLLAFTGPTGGYLLGFLVSTYCIARLTQNNLSFLNCFIACIIGQIVLLTLGVLHLSIILGSLQKAFMVGALPFLVKDVISAVIAASAAQVIRAPKGFSQF